MATTVVTTPTGFAAFSRTVVSAAADLFQSVERSLVGDAKLRTAQSNAWDALCEDRARARARAEMDALVRTLLAADDRAGADVPSQPAPSTRPSRRTRAKSRRLATNARR